MQVVCETDGIDDGEEWHAHVREEAVRSLQKEERFHGIFDSVHTICGVCDRRSRDEHIAWPHKGISFGAVHEATCAVGYGSIIIPIQLI